jgi:hypothetical protein
VAIPSFDMNALMARRLGVDWIKVSGDRWMRGGDPDLVTEDCDRREEKFWCPEVRWAVGGKEYAAAVPVKTKIRRVSAVKFLWVEVIPAWWGHEMDQNEMLEELANLIKTTVTN